MSSAELSPLASSDAAEASGVSLVLATLALTVAFASWGLFAVVGVEIRDLLALSASRFGLLMASPMLVGALLCLPLGLMAERWGGKVLLLGCLLGLCPFLVWLSLASSFTGFVIAGGGLGLALGLFAAGLPYVAAFSRQGREGLSLGFFAAGMLGVGVTYLLVPMAAQAYGWRMVPLLYVVLVVVVAGLVALLADDDRPPRGRQSPTMAVQLGVLLEPRVWRLCLYYSFVFGGFLALALWLPDYLAAHYGLTLQSAAMLSLLFTLPGALTQIIGGLLADRSGARQVSWWVFWVCLVCLFFLSYPPTTMVIHGMEGDLHLSLHMPLPLFLLLVLVMGTAMGFGKGSLLRLLFNHYPDRIGVVGGLLVALGALSGFILPILFGLANQWIGVRSASFMLLYGFLATCMGVMYLAGRREKQQKMLAEAQASRFREFTAPLDPLIRSRH